MAVPLMFRRKSMDKNLQGSNQETLEDVDDIEGLSKNTKDLFELLEKLSGERLDDQRCTLPTALQVPSVSTANNSPRARSTSRLEAHLTSEFQWTESQLLRRILSRPPPFPMIVLPPSGGYRLDGGDENVLVPNSENRKLVPSLLNGEQSDCSLIEADANASLYRKYFLDKEHFNFVLNDNNLGPIVMSVKYETVNGKEHLRVILRRKYSILSGIIPFTFDTESMQALRIAKILCEDITADKYYTVLFPKASELILTFDEHVLVNKMKFGIVYQKPGQTTEEEMFGNETHSPAMEEFLQFLGKKVNLKGFSGFRGGLDTVEGLTGYNSFCTSFENVEIMFHVSTLLPYSRTDPQQLQRKRHIGNDVVTIVFQDGNTPFMPSMIASHFLHAFIIVQAVDPLTPNTRYKVAATYRDDVPSFGPRIPNPPIFNKSEDTRKFLLSKLINAEISSLKAKKFASLERRTKDSLLQALHDTLIERTIDFCGFTTTQCSNNKENEQPSGFFDSVRKALSGRNRSHSVESNIAHTTPKRSSSRASNSSLTGTLTGDTTPSTIRAQSSQVLDAATSTSPVYCQFKLGKKNSPGTPVSNSSTPPSLQSTMCESDSSSMNSFDFERPAPPEDSDTGMESMSSADGQVASSSLHPPHACLFYENEKVKSFEDVRRPGNEDVRRPGNEDVRRPGNEDVRRPVNEDVRRPGNEAELEISKLKIDKLNLLKEVSACQVEMKRLKTNEIKLSTELSIIKQDNKRLANALASYQNGHDSIV